MAAATPAVRVAIPDLRRAVREAHAAFEAAEEALYIEVGYAADLRLDFLYDAVEDAERVRDRAIRALRAATAATAGVVR